MAEAAPPIFLEVRGDSSRHREGFLLRPAAGTNLTVEKSESALGAMDAYRLACRAASLEAFDELRRVSHGTLPSEDEARAWLAVVPSPDRRWAVVFGVERAGLRFVDMTAGTVKPWPEGLGPRVRGPVLWSPDSRYLVLSSGDEEGGAIPQRTVILDVTLGNVVLETVPSLMVNSLGWNSESNTLAVLTRAIEPGRGLIDRAGAAIGHGGFTSDLGLVLIEVPGGERHDSTVAQDVRSGTGEIVWDPRATSLMMGEVRSGRVEQGPPPPDAR